jgi:hypothetical protein
VWTTYRQFFADNPNVLGGFFFVEKVFDENNFRLSCELSRYLSNCHYASTGKGLHDLALSAQKFEAAGCSGRAVLGCSSPETVGSNLASAWTCAFFLCCSRRPQALRRVLPSFDQISTTK